MDPVHECRQPGCSRGGHIGRPVPHGGASRPSFTATASWAMVMVTASGSSLSASTRRRRSSDSACSSVVVPFLDRMSWRTPDTYQPAGLRPGIATSTSTPRRDNLVQRQPSHGPGTRNVTCPALLNVVDGMKERSAAPA
jgi:hypothetical protein